MRRIDPWWRKTTSALDVPSFSIDSGFRRTVRGTTTCLVMLTVVPKLTVTESSTIPTADPRLLFWVVGVVLGVLALWVIYLAVRGENRKPPPSTHAQASGDGAE